MSERIKCMFDTTIFNRVVEHKVPIEKLTACVVAYATPLQWHEINRTQNCKKKEELCHLFRNLFPEESHSDGSRVVPTPTTVWNVSPWGSGQWSESDSLYGPILTAMDELRRHKNNPWDALIAETAIKNGFTLVTDDGNLGEVAQKFGANRMTWTDLRGLCVGNVLAQNQ